MTSRERLRGARLDEKNGRLKRAAQQYAALSLLFVNRFPKRSIILISSALRLASHSPKLHAISAFALSKSGDLGGGRLALERFLELVDARSDRDVYIQFLDKLCRRDVRSRLLFDQTMQRKGATADRLDDALTDLIGRLEVTLEVARADESLPQGFVENIAEVARGDDELSLDLSVGLMEMELYNHAKELNSKITARHLEVARLGIRGEILMRERNWLELSAHAATWDRMTPVGPARLECLYERLMASVKLGDWVSAERVAQLMKHHADYRSSREFIDLVKRNFRRVS